MFIDKSAIYVSNYVGHLVMIVIGGMIVLDQIHLS